MLALLRLALVGFVILTLVYVGVSIWSRQMRRRKLRRQWKDEGRTGDRDAWIRDGLEDYDDSFRRHLILLVYIVPVAIIGLIIYAVNFM
ncbi:hypothetical protein [Pseudooceanicola aestuarii]|uniref:hypothetical protein n=1 Tax=Pseudooceanicola aestuarii TaxID=2697319 RepID=UPI0013D617A8|nr:hypothetical protein [Pseudooceanicola aestuarii]